MTPIEPTHDPRQLAELLHFLSQFGLYAGSGELPDYRALDMTLGAPARRWEYTALALGLDGAEDPDTAYLRSLAAFPAAVVAQLAPHFAEGTGPQPTGIGLAQRMIIGVFENLRTSKAAAQRLATVVSEATRLLTEALGEDAAGVGEAAKDASQSRLLALAAKVGAVLKARPLGDLVAAHGTGAVFDATSEGKSWDIRAEQQAISDRLHPGPPRRVGREAANVAATLTPSQVGYALWLCGFHPGDDPMAVFTTAAKSREAVQELETLLAARLAHARDSEPLTLVDAVRGLLDAEATPATTLVDAQRLWLVGALERRAEKAEAELELNGDAQRIREAVRAVLQSNEGHAALVALASTSEALARRAEKAEQEQQELIQRAAAAESKMEQAREGWNGAEAHLRVATREMEDAQAVLREHNYFREGLSLATLIKDLLDDLDPPGSHAPESAGPTVINIHGNGCEVYLPCTGEPLVNMSSPSGLLDQVQETEAARTDLWNVFGLGRDDDEFTTGENRWAPLVARARLFAATVLTAAQLQAAQDSPSAAEIQIDMATLDPELITQGLVRDYRMLAAGPGLLEVEQRASLERMRLMYDIRRLTGHAHSIADLFTWPTDRLRHEAARLTDKEHSGILGPDRELGWFRDLWSRCHSLGLVLGQPITADRFTIAPWKPEGEAKGARGPGTFQP